MKPFKSFLATEMENFISYRQGLGYSCHSLRWALLAFDEFLMKQPNLSDIWAPHFYIAFRHEIGLEPAGVIRILNVIRAFFEYLRRKRINLDNPLKDIAAPGRRTYIPFIFSPEQVELLLEVVCGRIRQTQKRFLKDLSEYLVILLLARCGLRINEPLRLRLGNYRSDEKTIYIERTKFKKDRLIPIPKSTARQIDNYLSSRAALIENDMNPYLFVGIGKSGLSGNRIRSVFHDAVRQIGINSPRRIIGNTTFGNPTPHSLRHSFAINTLKTAITRKQSPRNVLPVLADYMGHVEYEHTMEYLKVVDAESRNRLFKFTAAKGDQS